MARLGEQPKPIPSNINAVRITYYIESSANTIRSHRKIKPRLFPRKAQTGGKCGYDRRAELLSYTNQLRKVDSNSNSNSSSNRKKKWKCNTTTARLSVFVKLIFRRMKGGTCKHEQMPSEERININSRKRNKNSRNSSSQFCKKFKCIVKSLSFGRRKA